jgi:PTS system mannose-specific IID component
MPRLSDGDLKKMALRASFLQATWNYERQQGLGWAWSLKPAIDRLYPEESARLARLAEHTAYFNTQPTLASVVLGVAAGLEERRASGEGPDADGMSRVKSVLGSAAAAVGDRLFWFTLRPFAACLGVMLALRGSWLGAVALWLVYNLIHQGIRFAGVRWGYREGPAVFGGPLRGRLETMVRGLAIAGSALIGVLVANLLVPGGQPRPVGIQALLAIGLVFGTMTAQRSRPSPTIWSITIAAACLLGAWLR